MNGKFLKKIAFTLLGLVVLNLISSNVYYRFDLTEDKRYTLSDVSKEIIRGVQDPVIIDVLLDGNLQPEFKKLQIETRQLLEEISDLNRNIKFSFINPLEDEKNPETVIAQLNQLGLTPASVTVEEGTKVSQEFVFPWAMANKGDQTVRIKLLQNRIGAKTSQRVNNSIQQLEYAFTDAFAKLTTTQKKTVAILKGNGELDDIYIADFLKTLQEYYNIAPITLDSVATAPQKTLDQLNTFDLTIMSKPTQAFTDEEKYIMDQYVMQGGKTLWLIDQVAIEMDSLYSGGGKALAFPRNLNITDLLFSYGVRVNPVLINDIYCTQIVLAAGEGTNAEYNPLPWIYAPLVISPNNHPITNNIEALRFQFANTIDTLKNDIKKHILLTSSPLTRVIGTPIEVNLDIITKAPERERFNAGQQNLAVLLEGNFNSAFKNRVKPLKLKNALDNGIPGKMIVVADGDVIKNQLNRGTPLELGYDKWTSNRFGNKEFLINAVNYLLNDEGLVNIRSKEVNIPLLDQEKVVVQKGKWQLINLISPLLLLVLFYFIFKFTKKRANRA